MNTFLRTHPLTALNFLCLWCTLKNIGIVWRSNCTKHQCAQRSDFQKSWAPAVSSNFRKKVCIKCPGNRKVLFPGQLAKALLLSWCPGNHFSDRVQHSLLTTRVTCVEIKDRWLTCNELGVKGTECFSLYIIYIYLLSDCIPLILALFQECISITAISVRKIRFLQPVFQ